MNSEAIIKEIRQFVKSHEVTRRILGHVSTFEESIL